MPGDSNLWILIGTTIVAVGVFITWQRSGGGGGTYRADSLMSAGMLFKQQRDYVQAELSLEKALAELETMRPPDVSKTISCLVALANTYEANGKHDKARQAFKTVLGRWKGMLARNELPVVDIDYAMSNMDFGSATYDVAEFYIDSIVMSREKTLPKGHTDVLNSHKIGAILLRKAGYTKEADELEARGKSL